MSFFIGLQQQAHTLKIEIIGRKAAEERLRVSELCS